MRRIGILSDNISGNIGDAAIGLSVKKMLNEMQLQYDELVPGRFNIDDYEKIIVGGGDILRTSPDFFYDKFKITGKHILNSCGIVGSPDDLQYLDNYSYVSVRSNEDRKKLQYLKRYEKDVKVVPCTSMLLDDIDRLKIPIKEPSVGINLVPNIIKNEELQSFIDWISSLELNVYFLPITYYNFDFLYLNNLNMRVKNSHVIQLLNPVEIFTIIGKFNYFVSCSLHGSIFSYVHNIPFAAFNIDKIRFFMKERGLEKYLFSNYMELRDAFINIVNDCPNYETKIVRDRKVLDEHKKNIEILLKNDLKQKTSVVYDIKRNEKIDYVSQFNNLAIIKLQSDIIKIEKKASKLEKIVRCKDDEISVLNNKVEKLTYNLRQIEGSLTWRIIKKYRKFLNLFFPSRSK